MSHIRRSRTLIARVPVPTPFSTFALMNITIFINGNVFRNRRKYIHLLAWSTHCQYNKHYNIPNLYWFCTISTTKNKPLRSEERQLTVKKTCCVTFELLVGFTEQYKKHTERYNSELSCLFCCLKPK